MQPSEKTTKGYVEKFEKQNLKVWAECLGKFNCYI